MGLKITKSLVDKTRASEKVLFKWDSELKGFGLKVTPAQSKIYVVQYRIGGRGNTTKRYTIGKHGPLTPEEARREAKHILGKVAQGIDPQLIRSQEKEAISISELCDEYLQHGCATKKDSTIVTDRGRIKRHIKPLIGNKRVKNFTSNDVTRFMRDIAEGKSAMEIKTKKLGLARVTGGKGTASRTVGLLGGILSYAIKEGIIKENPVHGVRRYPDKKNERYLSSSEFSKLGEALVAAEKKGESLVALDAIRLLILTGCRKMEVLALTWEEIDFNSGWLRLKDSKTGQKIIPLGKPAIELLEGIRSADGNPYVFPGVKTDSHFVGLPKVWLRVREMAKLEDVRLHDLRHSFASVGAGAGLGLPVVGKLLGHADPKTTARYAHIADHPAKVAVDRISGVISNALENSDKADNVVNLHEK